MSPDLLAARIAARKAADEARADELRSVVRGLARELRRRGARRVVLFGSLVSGAAPHAESDIDLCVEGLGQADVERAELELTRATAPVHLVRWETAPAELRAVIERYGRALEDVE